MIQAVINALLADSTVTALVGDRIYPGILPQNPTFPALVLNVVSELDPVTHSGKSGLSDGQVQVDSFAADYLALDTLHRTVKTALNGYSVGNVQGIFLVRARDLYDNEAIVYRRTADYNVWSK
jgi:hypothetical protein